MEVGRHLRRQVLFLGLAVLSLLWSAYPGASAIGVTAQLATTLGGVVLAVTLSSRELLTALGRALRLSVGLSLLFELVIAVVVRQPVLPFGVEPPADGPTTSPAPPRGRRAPRRGPGRPRRCGRRCADEVDER